MTSIHLTAVANHLWQSTLFAAAASLLVLALRGNSARTRYWVWLMASTKFLIPFSLLVSIGGHLAWSGATPMAQPDVTLVVEQISQPFSHVRVAPSAVAPAPAAHSGALEALVSAAWASGFLLISFSWIQRWRRLRLAVQQGVLVAIEADVPVVSSTSSVEPGVFGIFRPVLLLPEGITEHLTPDHLRAVVAHEMCHVSKRDNLTALIQMAVEAIFWFHPLVWWLGGRLVEERERACDEEVLALGNRAEIYAESILKTCQFYLESPLACVPGVTGGELKKRIVRIMSRQISYRLEMGKKLLLMASGIAVVAGPLLIGMVKASATQAVSANTQISSTALLAFDVISIKPDSSGDRRMMLGIEPGGRFRANGVALKMIMQEAYSMKDSQIVGAPGWFNTDRFNIEAKADDALAEDFKKMSGEARKDKLMLMLRSLLADRCKMTVHQETKEMAVYSLAVGKGGPKFHESVGPIAAGPKSADGPPGPPGPGRQGVSMMGRGQLSMTSAPLSLFADVLSRQLGRPVLDDTGLKGNYDFALKFTPDDAGTQMPGGPGDGAPGPPPAEATGPSVFTAVQEQLGLKLESQKRPMAVIVIDHVEKPSEN